MDTTHLLGWQAEDGKGQSGEELPVCALCHYYGHRHHFKSNILFIINFKRIWLNSEFETRNIFKIRCCEPTLFCSWPKYLRCWEILDGNKFRHIFDFPTVYHFCKSCSKTQSVPWIVCHKKDCIIQKCIIDTCIRTGWVSKAQSLKSNRSCVR